MERRYFWSQTLKSWKIWTREKSMLEDSMQKGMMTPENSEKFIFPFTDGSAKLSGRDYGSPKTHSKLGTTYKE